MLNTYNSNQNIKINAVSGTIVKNYRDSFFVRFNLKSEQAKNVLRPDATYQYASYTTKKEIVVLQSMICGDMEVICEVMWAEDFDRLFGGDNDGTR